LPPNRRRCVLMVCCISGLRDNRPCHALSSVPRGGSGVLPLLSGRARLPRPCRCRVPRHLSCGIAENFIGGFSRPPHVLSRNTFPTAKNYPALGQGILSRKQKGRGGESPSCPPNSPAPTAPGFRACGALQPVASLGPTSTQAIRASGVQ
jgi:hypothetical protein